MGATVRPRLLQAIRHQPAPSHRKAVAGEGGPAAVAAKALKAGAIVLAERALVMPVQPDAIDPDSFSRSISAASAIPIAYTPETRGSLRARTADTPGADLDCQNATD